MADGPDPQAWLPFSIAEAALSGAASAGADLSGAWSHLLGRLKEAEQLVVSAPVNRNRIDYAAGMRHLMVLLAVGIDKALRVDPDPILAVDRASMDDIVTWGMECPDCVYLRATLRGWRDIPAVRQPGHRAVCRPADDGRDGRRQPTASSTNSRWMPTATSRRSCPPTSTRATGCGWHGDHPTLTVRHFFYDWDTEVPSSLQIERIGDEVEPKDRSVDLDVAVSRQLYALGGVRPRQSEVLPGLQRRAAGQRFHAADGPDRDGRGGRKPARHRPIRVGARRSADPRSRTPRGGLLELLARQSVVGDHPLRTSPVQPERASGGRRPRRNRALSSSAREIPASRTGSTPRDTATAR